ncbi:MAG: transposon-encoded TnpW family protein [Defluviitaleaceae bacterium]|nr:transposon-encoded TnpW family protein [Defluviitaleaceae bacterium]
MQTKITTAVKSETMETMRLRKRIGSTTFDVVIHFSQTKGRESVEDKILRLIESEVSKGA